MSLQRVNLKELPHFTGYLRKALRTAAANLVGDELHGFKLKVPPYMSTHACYHVRCHQAIFEKKLLQ